MVMWGVTGLLGESYRRTARCSAQYVYLFPRFMISTELLKYAGETSPREPRVISSSNPRGLLGGVERMKGVVEVCCHITCPFATLEEDYDT